MLPTPIHTRVDKEELQVEDEMMVEMSQIAKQNFPSVIEALEKNSPIATPIPLTVSIFEYLNKNSDFMRAVLGPKGDLSFQTRLKDFMWKTMFGNEPNALIKEEKLLVPAQYLTSYVASAHIGVIQQWLESGMKESPHEMARILSTITVNGPFFAAGLKK